MEHPDQEVQRDLEDAGTGSERDRSTIRFPYLDLDNAIEIAKAVHTLRGYSCEWEQLGAKFGVSAKGAGFHMRVQTAKIFGLVSYDRSTVTLTEIGIRATNAQQEKAARVDAFLTVPLYRQIYEQFKENPFPGVTAIESFMVGIGVANKVKEKARQVFERSAKQAGFFDQSPDRMAMPFSTAGGRRAGDKEDPQQGSNGAALSRAGSAAGTQLPPIIEGLLNTLPPAGSCWEMENRAKWLQAAVNIFDLIYTTSDPSKNLSVHIDA